MNRTLFLLIAVALAYWVGAKFPGIAQRLGVA